jgi:hypothetical protein
LPAPSNSPHNERPAPLVASKAASCVFTQRPDAEILGLWIADAILASRLGWPMPLPLLAVALMHSSLRNNRDGGLIPAMAPQIAAARPPTGRAAAEAWHLFAELDTFSVFLLQMADARVSQP